MNPSTHSLTSHTFHGLEPGPRLIVLGAVHGNEIGGTRGIERVLDELARGDLVIVRGSVTFVPIAMNARMSVTVMPMATKNAH